MLTSNYDQRGFHYETMPNGLRVLVVQDENCKKSAVSLTVGAGHFNDPQECEGLAHLLEHMLFLGSTNFPQPNALNDFLSQRGGGVNAWTGTEYSCFHFDVASDFIHPACMAFTDMLTSPLIDISLIEKEIEAIEAEFRMKQKDDLRRLYQVHKETCNPAHPFSKFSVGNAETFGTHSTHDLQQMLTSFHQQHFVAKNMTLCVITELESASVMELVQHVFSALPDNPLPKNPTLPPLYLDHQLGAQINIRPVKHARRLIVTFALPDVQKYYRTKPLALLSHVLGDEGHGSLLACFKNKNWATSLSAGGGINGENFKDFNLNLQLTDSGMEHIDDILEHIFYYLQLIKSDINEKWRFDEKSRLNQLAFDFSEQGKPLDEAISLSNQMFHYPQEHAIAGEYLVDEYAPDVLNECLQYFSPENMRVKVIHMDVETDSVARWYDTPYKISSIPSDVLASLHDVSGINGLSLPEHNPYILTSTDCHPHEAPFKHPKSLISEPGINVWFAQDHKFGLPKGDCFISFDTLHGCATASDSLFKRIWVAMMMEQFNNDYYQAGVAGLHYHLYPHQAGFSLHTNGFSAKQLALSQDLFQRLFEQRENREFFDQVRVKQLHALQNALLNKPVNRLFTRLSVILQRYAYAPQDVLPVVEHATYEDVIATRDRMLNNFYLESFVHGDWTSSDASAFAEGLLEQTKGINSGTHISRDVVDISEKGKLLHVVESQHEDAAAVVYFQAPTSHHSDVARMILIEQLIAAQFFNQVRTEKQMGYLVGTGYMPYNQHPGIAFYIQSPRYDANILVNEIEAFIQQTLNNMQAFSEAFESIKQSVVKQLVEKDTNLSMKSQRLWMAIGNGDTDFTQQNKLADALLKISLNDIQDFATALLNREHFGELVMISPGKFSMPDIVSATEIEDISNFKQNCQFTL